MHRLKTIASRGRTHDDDDIPDIAEMRDPVSWSLTVKTVRTGKKTRE
jgi:hypothetical protein